MTTATVLPTPTMMQLVRNMIEESPPYLVVLATFAVAILLTLLGLLLLAWYLYNSGKVSPAMIYHHDQRRRLPKTIIVIRHGESEANADKTLWKTIPDNLLSLTPKGQHQAKQVGHRVEAILAAQNCQRVHLVISPFQRTNETAQQLRKAFEPRIVRTEIESRIREQEVGNLQGDEFCEYRSQQQKVGRFWYRFPTGESGADVLDRVKSWWHESVLTVNLRAGYEPVDAMIVVTHGLTMRFILAQLFGWSPTTFHSVWNANNCDMYVLQKDLKFPGISPYALSEELGDVPKSSIDVSVELKDGTKHLVKLDNYLGIPPPRTKQTKLIRRMLCQQYPKKFSSPKEIRELLFMPFMEGGIIRGRSSSGTTSRRMTQADSNATSSVTSSDSDTSDNEEQIGEETNDMNQSVATQATVESDSRRRERRSKAGWFRASFMGKRAKREMSMRYPPCKLKNWFKDLDAE